MSKRFLHTSDEILHSAYVNSRRDHRGHGWPSDNYLMIELLVDIRTLLDSLNENFAKIANPLHVARDATLEKIDNSTTFQPSQKTTNTK